MMLYETQKLTLCFKLADLQSTDLETMMPLTE